MACLKTNIHLKLKRWQKNWRRMFHLFICIFFFKLCCPEFFSARYREAQWYTFHFLKCTSSHCIVSRVMNCLIMSMYFSTLQGYFYFYERSLMYISPSRKMYKSPSRKHRSLLRTYYPVRSLSWYFSLWPSVWSLFLCLSNYFKK